MSVCETSIKNPKKIADFYKQLCEQKDIEIKQLKLQLEQKDKKLISIIINIIKEYEQKIDFEIDMGSQGEYKKIKCYEEFNRKLNDLKKLLEKNDKYFENFMNEKKNYISTCVDLSKYFVGRHNIIPVYLTPAFEQEFNSKMYELAKLAKEKQEIIDYLKEKIEECYISGDCRPLKELKEILSKIEKR